MKFGWKFLWSAVAVVEQLGELPPAVAESLPLSHHKLLLAVHDPAQKVELAKAAVAEDLSKRDLEQRIQASKTVEPGAAKVGRPPLPAFLKAATVLKSAAALAKSQPVRAADFAHVEAKDLQELLAEMDRALDELDDVVELVRQMVVKDEGGGNDFVPPGEQSLGPVTGGDWVD